MENQGYPQNLIDAIAIYSYKPKMITDDIIAGINYAISTLTTKEQRFIRMRFQDELSPQQLCAEFGKTTDELSMYENIVVRKLRHPWIYRYILHGIEGYVLQKSITEFFHGYWLGYQDAHDGKRNEAFHSFMPSRFHSLPSIEQLGLSKRTFNCLTKAGIISIADCLKLRDEDIKSIRGLGPVGADEVARAIVNAHIFSYQWEKYLVEPVKQREDNFYHVEIRERNVD